MALYDELVRSKKEANQQRAEALAAKVRQEKALEDARTVLNVYLSDTSVSSVARHAMAKSAYHMPAADPEYSARKAQAVGPLVSVDEVGGVGKRYLRSIEIESVSPHAEGAIIKTKSGDFHRTAASPEDVVDAMNLAERS